MLGITHNVCGIHNMEKGEMNIRNVIIAGIAVIAGALTLTVLGTGRFGLLSSINVAVIIGIAGFVIGKFLDMKQDEKEGFAVKDERTILLEARAASVGFKLGNFVWLGIIYYDFIGDHFTGWAPLNTQQALLLGLLVNLGIYFASMVYYRNRV